MLNVLSLASTKPWHLKDYPYSFQLWQPTGFERREEKSDMFFFPLLSLCPRLCIFPPCGHKTRTLSLTSGCFKWVDKHVTPCSVSSLFFPLNLGGSSKRRSGWRFSGWEAEARFDVTASSWGKIKRQPGINIQGPRQSLGLTRGRRPSGKGLCEVFALPSVTSSACVILTWIAHGLNLPSALFNTHTPHCTHRCHEVKVAPRPHTSPFFSSASTHFAGWS